MQDLVLRADVVSFQTTVRRFRLRGKSLSGKGIVEISSRDEDEMYKFKLKPFSLKAICGALNLLRTDGFIRTAESFFEENKITKDIFREITSRLDLLMRATPISDVLFVLKITFVFQASRLETLVNFTPHGAHPEILLISSTLEIANLFCVFFLSTGVGYYNDLVNLVVLPTKAVEPYKSIGIAQEIPFIQKIFRTVDPHLAFFTLRERLGQSLPTDSRQLAS